MRPHPLVDEVPLILSNNPQLPPLSPLHFPNSRAKKYTGFISQDSRKGEGIIFIATASTPTLGLIQLPIQ
jgi:hypothetical protein